MPIHHPTLTLSSSPPLPPSPSPHAPPRQAADTISHYSCLPCLLLFTDLSQAQRHYQATHPLPNNNDLDAVTAEITLHQLLPEADSACIRQRDRANHLVDQVRASRIALQASGAHRVLRDLLQTPGAGLKRAAAPVFEAPARKASRAAQDPIPAPETVVLGVKLPGPLYVRVEVPLSVSTYDAMLALIARECDVTERALRRLARISWVVEYALLQGEAVLIRVYDDQAVLEVMGLLGTGEGWCRMVIGL